MCFCYIHISGQQCRIDDKWLTWNAGSDLLVIINMIRWASVIIVY